MIAEVLEVDLDFLVSGTKTPSQEFQSIRRYTDAALRNLVGPVVDALFALAEAHGHLQEHPELINELSDANIGQPTSPSGYLDWVADRLASWDVDEDECVVASSEEEAARFVEVVSRLARNHVVLESQKANTDDVDGEHPEKA